MASPADVTAVVPEAARTELAELAWSEDAGDLEPRAARASWRAVWSNAALLLVLGVIAAVATALVAWFSIRDDAPAPPTEPTPTHLEAADTKFLSMLDRYEIDLSDLMGQPMSPLDAAKLGHRICINLHSGGTMTTVAQDLSKSMPKITEKQAANLVWAAQFAICPDEP